MSWGAAGLSAIVRVGVVVRSYERVKLGIEKGFLIKLCCHVSEFVETAGTCC